MYHGHETFFNPIVLDLKWSFLLRRLQRSYLVHRCKPPSTSDCQKMHFRLFCINFIRSFVSSFCVFFQRSLLQYFYKKKLPWFSIWLVKKQTNKNQIFIIFLKYRIIPEVNRINFSVIVGFSFWKRRITSQKSRM